MSLQGRAQRVLNAGARWLRLRRQDFDWLTQRSAFERRYPQLQRDHQWVFIVGCNNSGTTLVHDVLAATGHFSFLAREGQQYTSALVRGDRRGHERVWSEYLDDLRITESSAAQPGVRLLFDWLRELGPGVKSRVLEKSTVNAVRMRWLQAVFPRALFIGVVRDAHAVTEGIRRKAHKSMQRSARHWTLVNRLMLEDARSVQRFQLVKYEEFVSAPAQALPQLAHFLDLPVQELQEAFDRNAVKNMNAQSLSRLSEADLRAVANEAGTLLDELGYRRAV